MPDHDEPKISPSAMKAAGEIIKAFNFFLGNIPTHEYRIAQIIDDATHLSAKEAALWELVEAVKRIKVLPQHNSKIVIVINAAIAKANEALKP